MKDASWPPGAKYGVDPERGNLSEVVNIVLQILVPFPSQLFEALLLAPSQSGKSGTLKIAETANAYNVGASAIDASHILENHPSGGEFRRRASERR